MRPELTEIAETVVYRLSHLNKEEASITTRLSEIQTEKTELNTAGERIELLRSGTVSSHVCFNCYVFHGNDSEMTPISSDLKGADLFRCQQCRNEVEIKQ